jgi:hypothetical protein
MPTSLTRMICIAAIATIAAGNLVAQTPERLEIAELRAQLRGALTRIELLERAALDAAPSLRVREAPRRRIQPRTPAPARQPRAFVEPVSTAPSFQSSRYTRGPRGGCYTFNALGRKIYVDRSLCR